MDTELAGATGEVAPKPVTGQKETTSQRERPAEIEARGENGCRLLVPSL